MLWRGLEKKSWPKCWDSRLNFPLAASCVASSVKTLSGIRKVLDSFGLRCKYRCSEHKVLFIVQILETLGKSKAPPFISLECKCLNWNKAQVSSVKQLIWNHYDFKRWTEFHSRAEAGHHSCAWGNFFFSFSLSCVPSMPNLLMFHSFKSTCAHTAQNPPGHIWFHLKQSSLFTAMILNTETICLLSCQSPTLSPTYQVHFY